MGGVAEDRTYEKPNAGPESSSRGGRGLVTRAEAKAHRPGLLSGSRGKPPKGVLKQGHAFVYP